MNKTQILILLDRLTKAISYRYKGNCAPGVTISWLPTQEYYISILKYGNSHLEKTVMHSARSIELYTAIKDVTMQFLDSSSEEKNPVDNLRDLIRNSNVGD